jgi:hypothetical protein
MTRILDMDATYTVRGYDIQGRLDEISDDIADDNFDDRGRMSVSFDVKRLPDIQA